MELFLAYKGTFLVTVVLPLITGIILAIGGYTSLKDRANSDAQLNRIDKNTAATLKNLPDMNKTIGTLDRYEKTLSELGARDNVLSAVLVQYKKMNQATKKWEEMRGIQNVEEKYELASEVLDIISSNLSPVAVRNDLPSHPLIIGLGNNTFRVLFAVPMRISPTLEFFDIPEGTTVNVLEKSKYGFTASFMPLEITVHNFNFTADARL